MASNSKRPIIPIWFTIIVSSAKEETVWEGAGLTVRGLKQESVRLKREAFSRLGSAAESLAAHPSAARAAEWAVKFALGAALGSARILGGASPFSAGFVAAAGTSLGGLFALLGASLGAALRMGISESVRYVAVAALVYAAALLFKRSAAALSRFFMPCVSAATSACVGLAYLIGDATVRNVSVYIIEVALTGISALAYADALTPAGEKRAGKALLFTAVTVMAALSEVRIFGVLGVGRAAAVALVLSSAVRGGAGSGAAAGAAAGLAMDAAAGGPPFFTPAYALAAVAAGLFRSFPRWAAASAYVVANALAAFWAGGEYLLPILAETFAGSVVFMLLPGKLLTSVHERVEGEETMDGAERFIGYVRGKTREAAEAMRAVHESIARRLPDVNDEDVSSVFDMAACSVCGKCRSASRCWQSDLETTRGAINDATEAMLRRGELDDEDLPQHFRDSCENLRGFTAAVNAELRALRARRMYRRRLNEGRDARTEQYRGMEELLSGVADALADRTNADRAAEKRLKLFLDGAGLQLRGGLFRDGSGRLHVELEGVGVSELKRTEKYLEKLSAAVRTRLVEDAETSTRTKLRFLQAEPLQATVGMAGVRREGQRVSGDSSAFFKTDEGTLCVILSDGMGTGEQAAAESAEAASILGRFLRAGVAPELSMKLLSSVMSLRSEDTMGAATADLMCIDLFSGSAGLYKYGASPTYLLSGGKIKRVSGENFAAGVGGFAAPDRTELTMKAGSVAVIVSDGVAADRDDSWIGPLIIGEAGKGPRALARAVLEHAVELHGASDDMTVLAVAVSER